MPESRRSIHRHSWATSARHCRRHSFRREGGASQRPALMTASRNFNISAISCQLSAVGLQCSESRERYRLQVLVPRQRGSERGGTLRGEVEVTARRTLVAARDLRVLPIRRQIAERLELVERGVDAAGGQAGGVDDVEAEAVGVGNRVENGDLAERERSRFAHKQLSAISCRLSVWGSQLMAES